MKRIFSFLLVLAVVSSSSPAYTEDNYDPQHTMLALNMAIVSIHRIISTQDRIILDQEYNTIINKLALGNIESDYEMTALFTELMNFITGKGLRQEEAKRFQERYNSREQMQLLNALSGIRAYGGNLWSWLGSLATSCVSSYFSYQSAKGELLEGLNDDLWQLKKEDIADCNELQVKLLNSSWNLLRQYKLPDEYRLTQESLNGYYKAVNEPDPSKRLRMLRARNVERNFQIYSPYWYYRAKAAQESGNDDETAMCWDKFAEVWRPVLRNDPYKLEEAKYRVQKMAADSNTNREELRRLLKVIQDNITPGDWSNNLFVGVAYFLLGDKEEGIACVEENVDFDYEQKISSELLAQMKQGKLDLFSTPDKLKKEKRELTWEEIKKITSKYGFNDGRAVWKAEKHGWFGVYEISNEIRFDKDCLILDDQRRRFGGNFICFIPYHIIFNFPDDKASVSQLISEHFEVKIPDGLLENTVSALMEIKNLE